MLKTGPFLHYFIIAIKSKKVVLIPLKYDFIRKVVIKKIENWFLDLNFDLEISLSLMIEKY